ncbi:hypothetical protein B296_00029566, partial [Ensete ventricosum]
LHNRRVRPRRIEVGDLVLRKAEVGDLTWSWGKLAPNLEGPYRMESTIREGTYALVMMEGR